MQIRAAGRTPSHGWHCAGEGVWSAPPRMACARLCRFRAASPRRCTWTAERPTRPCYTLSDASARPWLITPSRLPFLASGRRPTRIRQMTRSIRLARRLAVSSHFCRAQDCCGQRHGHPVLSIPRVMSQLLLCGRSARHEACSTCARST